MRSVVLSHYEVPLESPRGDRSLKAILGLAEAVIPGSTRTPAADETTVARLHDIARELGPRAESVLSLLVTTLDNAARLSTGRPFHALPRAKQQDVLVAWEKSPILRGPLHAFAIMLKIAHFDRPQTYESLGGRLRVIKEAEADRWERNIKPAHEWTDDRDLECDVVIVGTGAGGAVLAKELADRGHAVVLVEEGKRRKRNEFVGSFVRAHTSYIRNTFTLGSSPVTVLTGKLVGGSTAVNGGTCLRPPPWVHHRWSEELGSDHMSMEAMSPYFDRVEAALQVALPERKHIGPIADVFDRGAKPFGWKVGPIPRNAPGCEGQGFCDFGCSSGARRAVDTAFLPTAVEKGTLLMTELTAKHVLTDRGRAFGVELEDKTGRTFTVRAKAVVLACGALVTPAFLMRQGIANSSGLVGRNLTLHPSGGVSGWFDELINPEQHIPQGYMVYEFLRDGIMINAAQPDLNIAHMMMPFTGQRLMRAIDSIPHLAMFGSVLRDETRGRVVTDVGGAPVVTYELVQKDVENMHRGICLTADMCFAAGARRVYTGLIGDDALESKADLERFKKRKLQKSELALVGYHPLGTCKMGTDKRTSVVGLDHETHDIKGLYIVDGSVVNGPLGVNPQITIMGMAMRAAEHLHDRL